MNRPIILNFDQSVLGIKNAINIDLSHWQDRVRFASSMRSYQALSLELLKKIPHNYGTVFLGSGDYHHISHLLISKLKSVLNGQKITIVIIDNHPDNMRFPFGIHCGSWVSHAAALPFVEHVHVLGITSTDIAISHAIENRLIPLLRSKLTYWSTGVNVNWAHKLGLKHAFRSFSNIDDLVSTFLSTQYHQTHPIYLSIDKDALSQDYVHTNWDQGVMEYRHVSDIIIGLSQRLIASDITGEVSNYNYVNKFKRFMSRLDGQAEVAPEDVVLWQKQQEKFNQKLLQLLDKVLPNNMRDKL